MEINENLIKGFEILEGESWSKVFIYVSLGMTDSLVSIIVGRDLKVFHIIQN